MSRALFVSDIHLTSAQDPNCALFLRVLGRCLERRFDHIFLLGDIFDLWIADRDDFVKEYAPIIEQLRRLHAAGLRIHYFEGNHDLDLRRFWQHKMGLDVYSEAAFFKLGSIQVRAEHGDQMDPDDQGYLFLRWFLRTPFLIFLGRYSPNWVVQWIGRRASLKSRKYTSEVKTASDEEVRRKIRAHARKVFAEHPFDLIVSGHVHVVENSVQDVGTGKFGCINLGTWLKAPVVLELEDSKATLKGAEQFVAG